MTLTVSLFGHPRIGHNDHEYCEASGLPGELLALLVVMPGERVSRDAVGDQLWPGGAPDRNRRNLSTTLWRLRSLLGDAPDDVLVISPGGYLGINRNADLICDVYELEGVLDEISTVAPAKVPENVRDRLRGAVALYRGEFLEGVMSEWALSHRDRLAGVYQECLVRLMKISLAADDLDESAYWAERILERDPLREDIHRSLIKVYGQTGRRTDAVRQYERMRQLIADELRTTPSPETTSLFYRIIETQPADELPTPAVTPTDRHDTEPPGSSSADEPTLGTVMRRLADVERLLSENLRLLADYLDLSRR